MEGTALCLAAALVICFPASSHSQFYSLITPNVLRIESEEKIVVDAQGLNKDTEVTITVNDFPQKRNTLYMIKTILNQQNNWIATPVIKIPANEMKKDAKHNQYVVVQATCDQFMLQKVVLTSFHSGYIFIQTDKPIYTPGSQVRYRIFSVGNQMEPVAKTVVIEVETPEGIIVSQNSIASNAKNVPPYDLAELVSFGTWKFVAKYQDTPQQTFTTQFEVKPYVLPSFEVIVNPAEKFLYIDSNQDFRVSIVAKYTYGKRLNGMAFVLFGLLIEDEKKSIPDSLQRIPIEDGDGEAVLTRAALRARAPNLNDLVGQSLYISVTVLTDSGSDMVETEKTGIAIVTSPYKILFTKTPKYFKPGMPYGLMVFVTNPDGSPAANVPVVTEPIRAAAVTQQDGTAKLILNTLANNQDLRITVKTNHANLPNERQAVNNMVATAYQPQTETRNYLHLAVTATELKAGDNLPVNFNVKGDNLQLLNQIKDFTYIILNKGKVVKAARQPRAAGQNLITINLPITPDLIPSFRIVAYYQIGNTEVVADSVWVDVKDTCMGTLVVKGATEADNRIHTPGSQMKIKLEGDSNARVGLVAVDKGVFVLNNKFRLTQTKIWDVVEKSDIGCTAGSGRNNVGVFADAGLTLDTNIKISTPQRSDPKCSQPGRRRRRSIRLVEMKKSKAAEYQDPGLKKCCEDGMRDNPMGHSCEKRAEYILDQNACRPAFLACCLHIRRIREEQGTNGDLTLARSDVDDLFESDENIISRTEFPESWMWQTEQLPEANAQGIASKIVSLFLKDSITTWEVLAVSISATKGVCVADPYEITVMKDFFIDLRLPYSVVRNEQVEIRAVLYNYGDAEITVRVELVHNPAFCSASTAKQRYRQVIKVKGQSSRAVPLVIVPLQLGLHDVEVKAAVQGLLVSDGVKKKLKVVSEGMQRKIVKVIELDPVAKGQNGVQRELVPANNLDDKVPDSEIETKVNVQGTPVAQIIEDSIDGSHLSHLIITPSGCGEQNMITMTPSVIATIYLDTTEQWEKVGVERRATAIDQIMRGYAQEMTYKKADHSYAAFADRPASTWLTAYVVKVFAMAFNLAKIDVQVLCGGVKWLILERQKPDGVFQENAPVIHGEMVGGYKGAEPEVSLTAFVLVALLESKAICKEQVPSLEGSITKAADYLSRKYESLERPYTVALTSYALTLAGRLNNEAILMRASTDRNRWEERGALTYNIEGTSYALLALLKMEKFNDVGPVVKWLVQQKYYGGTYGHTQSTIMVFQALAQYQIDIPTHKDLNLDVTLLLPQREHPVVFRIAYENSLLARSAETKINEEFTVSASGQGQGTMTIVTMYNAQLREQAAQCKNFELTVSVEQANLARKVEGALGAVKIKICARYLGQVDATMSIIDISMLTGFAPDTEELKRLSEGVDRYISKYEIDNVKSERGNLILYLDKVSHRKDECLDITAYKYFEVGLIQPASVTVYSYYSLDDRCTKFYHPSKASGLLNKICHGEVCRCAEESCQSHQKDDQPLDLQRRIEAACKEGVDYVYKAKVMKIEGDSYVNYVMNVLEVIKAGTDGNAQAKPRMFISHMKCQEHLNLEVNKDYLVWGLSTDLWHTKSDINYLITKDTWIERWPSEDECQEEEYENLCNDLAQLARELTLFGCPS